MKYWKLTKKNLFGKNRYILKGAHLLSLIGIIIGVTALLVVSSVMNGLRDDMAARITDTKAEIKVYRSDMRAIDDYASIIKVIEENRNVTAVSPVIRNELLIQKGEMITAVETFGIDPQRHTLISGVGNHVRVGSLNALNTETDGIVIGIDLSMSIGATVGEYIMASSPIKSEPTPFGLLPKTKRLKVVGIFLSGMPQYDKSYTYLSLNNGRFFSGYDNEVDMLQVKIDNPNRSERVAAQLQNVLGSDYLAEDWSVFDSSLFEAMKLEKIVMLTVLALMLVISGFNMACSSIRMVAEKRIDIGILKAIGMKTRDINTSFMMTNMIIGISGIITGVVISAIFVFVQENYKIIAIPVPGFPMHWLPVSPSGWDFITVILLVLAITILATIIPLRKIRKMEPISVIRQML